MNLDRQQLGEFREVFLVANTPLYLLKHLRRLPALQRLVQTASSDQLVSEYMKRQVLDDLTLDDAAVTYACLVAILCKSSSEARLALRALDPHLSEWGRAIRDSYLATTPAENARWFSFKTVPSTVTFSRTSSATSRMTEAAVPRVEREANQ